MSRIVMALGVVGLLLTAAPLLAKELPSDIQALLDSEKYAAVVAPLTEHLDKKKKSLEGWTALGFAYYNLERWPEAREAYEKALKLKKKHWPAVHGWLRTIIAGKDLDAFADADERARKAIKDTKKDEQMQAMFYHDLGLLQLALGSRDTLNIDQALLDSAETNFYIASAQAPDSCAYRLDRGEISFTVRRYPMAISAYEEVLACDADMAGPVHYRIARAYLYQREFKQAVKAYRESAAARPTAKVYSDLGDALVLQSRSLDMEDSALLSTTVLDLYNQAIDAYRQAKEYTSDGCRIYEKLGKAEALMGQTTGSDEQMVAAADDFKAAIECGSTDPDVFFALGNVLVDLARFDEALDWYDRYRGMREARLGDEPWGKPDADFFANYGYVLRVKADSTAADETLQDSLFMAAIASYQRAIELDPDRSDMLSDLGIALYQQARYDDAIPVFQKKIEMEPELANGYLNLAYCFLQQKRYDSVLAALDGMLAVDSCNVQAFEIAGYITAFEMKNGRLARKWYNRQLVCDPTNCDAKMYIGYTYLVTNDTAQIRRCIPVLKDAYECRRAKGETVCGDNFKSNTLWIAEAYLALRNLDEAATWAGKVLACEPGHERARQIKEQAESEY